MSDIIPKNIKEEICSYFIQNYLNSSSSLLNISIKFKLSKTSIKNILSKNGLNRLKLFLDNEPKNKWVPIPGYTNYYVTEFGDVLGSSGWVMTPGKNTGGYLTVKISINGKAKRIEIHRLVGITFLGPKPEDKNLLAHNDGNCLNNHKNNLRWATFKENVQDSIIHGTFLAGKFKSKQINEGL